MTKPIWKYYFARKFSASRFEVVMRVFVSEYYRKTFGVRLQNILVKPAAGNHAICYVEPEWNQFAKGVYTGACRDVQTFRKFERVIVQTQSRSLRVAEHIARESLQRRSWKELGALWKQWDAAHLDHFLKPIWIPFIIEPLLASDAMAALTRHHAASDEIETVFGPDRANAVSEERHHLVGIAVQVRQKRLGGRALTKALERHAKVFGFIPCYDVIDAPWDIVAFRRELKTLLKLPLNELQSEYRTYRKKFVDRRRAFQSLIRQRRFSTREKALLSMAHSLAFIKDERDDYRRRQSFAIRPLFAEIARRAQLPFRAPLYLLHDEMVSWFATGRLPIARKEIVQRMRGYCIVKIDGGSFAIYSGLRMQQFLARQKFQAEEVQSSEVAGIVGYPGNVVGRVRVVRTKHDLRRVQKGDILIAVTTNPDYVPAMRKCKAFVTDEGGLTSHAAIVARELHVPCIVGTRRATSIFRDGERVEVDADRGIVRRLK